MTRRWHLHQRLVHILPAEVLLTPGTFDQEIMLAQRLVVRAEHAGVLAQTTALAPDLGGPPRPPGSPPAQPTAAREHTLGAREVSEAAAGQGCRSHVIRPS